MAVISTIIRRFPVTLSVTALLTLTAIISGNLIHGPSDTSFLDWATGVDSTVEDRQWWTVITTLFIPADLPQFIGDIAFSLVLLGISERLLGPGRTLLAYLVTGVLGVSVGLGLQLIGSSVGEWWASATVSSETLDPLAPVVGAFITASAFASGLWRRRMRVMTFAVLIAFVLYSGSPSDTYRLIAAVVGVPLGILLAGSRPVPTFAHSPRMRRRRLLATITAITAIGPVVALSDPSGLTPFSIVSRAVASGDISIESLLQRCSTAQVARCEQLILHATAVTPLTISLSLVPAALLLTAAWGLSRGRRFGLWLAIAVNVVVSVTSMLAINLTAAFGEWSKPGWTELNLLEIVLGMFVAVAVPLAMAVVLFLQRRYFSVTASRQTTLRLAGTWLASFILLFAVALVTQHERHPTGSATRPLWRALREFLPSHAINLPQTTWVGPAFWLVVIIGALFMIADEGTAQAPRDRRRMRELLRTGGGSLSFMATWPDVSYWFSPDGNAAVAFRLTGGVALTVSNPICRPEELGLRVTEFADYCDERNWIPAFYSVHSPLVPVFEQLGWQTVEVGQESRINLDEFDLSHKTWAKVRHAVNRAEREGVEANWTTWSEIPVDQVRQIQTISRDWVDSRALPEMGFTLGTLAELEDADVRLLIAHDSQGRVHAVTSWLPIYEAGEVQGWTLDVMRRSPTSMNGVMEFLIATAVSTLREEGAEVISLSGVPLTRLPDSDAPQTALDRALGAIATRLEPSFGFSALLYFKAKFNPTYETLFMGYQDPLELPRIARALARAYLPDVTARQAWGILRRRRAPQT
jgi:phosphatidylglycerol lysyltransferase